METETFFDTLGQWKIELYHTPRRESYKVGMFWDDECSMDEAYGIFTEMFSAVPPHAAVEHACSLPEEEPMRYEVRLYGPHSPAAVAIISWPQQAVEFCVTDYKERKIIKKVITMEVEVGEEDGEDPSEWDWSDIIETGSFRLLDNTEETC